MIFRPILGTSVAAAMIILSVCGGNIMAAGAKVARFEERSSVSQYGITWTFSRPRKVGRFVTGDWWVLGPVKIVRVTPSPGPAPLGERIEIRKNQFGDTALRNDGRMRNGSMIVVKGSSRQGYDSRAKNYDPTMSVAFPFTLKPNQSLISSVSHTSFPNNNFCHKLMWSSEKQVRCILKSAAVLTCLAKEPPVDAFRPSYGGSEKKIYRVGDLKRALLGRLKPVGEVPSWEQFERYFERPWIDHIETWMIQRIAPTENQPSYGREYGRLGSIASLMLQLDVPAGKKEKLLLRFVQLGIDLSGLHRAGTTWLVGGGHSSGRKWPILFASLMLGDKDMLVFRKDTNFQEDGQTYYGRGWAGQRVLWQMLIHHGKRRTYEERPPERWDAMDRRSEGYRLNCTAQAWIGTALAARYMKAVRRWNHDAFFDYCDRWMRQDDPYADKRGRHKRPRQEGKTFDPWVDAMWRAYRKGAPDQPGGTRNLKWVWTDGGKWVQNPKPRTLEQIPGKGQ